MYIAITGSKNNKDVYIYRSFRKENGKASSCIYKKLGKYNALLEQFDGNEDKLMVWAKGTGSKRKQNFISSIPGKVSVEFSSSNFYTADQILETLRSMQMTLLNTASGYIPSYTRTELTDALHKIFDFRTDHEFITKADMRTLIKNTKQIKSKQG